MLVPDTTGPFFSTFGPGKSQKLAECSRRFFREGRPPNPQKFKKRHKRHIPGFLDFSWGNQVPAGDFDGNPTPGRGFQRKSDSRPRISKEIRLLAMDLQRNFELARTIGSGPVLDLILDRF
jgi:hypothetical protein